MEPFPLSTRRLVLDQPTRADVDSIADYCADPVFEHFMVTPWPYRRSDAEGFVGGYVPEGWSSGREWTWAIRFRAGGPLLGVIGIRTGTGSVGFWLGAPNRGQGLVPEALAAVVDAAFARTDLAAVRWECVIGNLASATVARKAGFRFTGAGAAESPARDGTPVDAWRGELARSDDRASKPGRPS